MRDGRGEPLSLRDVAWVAGWGIALFLTFTGLPILAAVANWYVTGQPVVWWPFS